ncbi:protein abnormal spindle [Pectinophora gossypiella]|uniref:protein abnormal spindle n=1 Tax=Pectinophora gossypiella TaxID=13191 RepID=UPI00214EED7D|nr:protein abnormal spindle [Pectinophora gossypiella]
MYFEIENTPEHIRRARHTEVVQKISPKEECPRLVLAPFSRPPQVVFENVLIGSTCERNLEVFNPSKQVQQITLGKALPPGLIIHLPGEWLELEPETCYYLTLTWSPMQPTALRDTIRFINENRGRYDVIVVLKSAMNVKGKGKTNQPKGFRVSPGKMKKKSGKRSPVAIYKKKSEVIFNTTKVKKTVVHSTQYNVLKPSNKENIPSFNDYSMESQHPDKCPFDSPTSIDFNFDTSEIFSNMRKTNTDNILQSTYEKPYNNKVAVPLAPHNVLKPSNKLNYDMSASELFDNLTFTPLKTNETRDKLEKGPKIILSMNSDSELDDSLDVKTSNNENETHSIICITSAQLPNKWLTVNHQQAGIQYIETPTVQNKKIPNTSSPKEMNSPNFSMNTELSRISDLSFFPQRFSTERKIIPKVNNETQEIFDDANAKLNSDTYTKDSPNTPLDFKVNLMYGETRPPHFFMKEQPKMCRQALFRESQQYREHYEKTYLNPSDINVWNRDVRFDAKSPPRSITPPLQSIPEESTYLCDTQVLDKTDKQMSTFSLPLNRTFDKVPDRNSLSTSTKQTWSKKSVRAEPELWKIPTAPPRKSLKPKSSISGKESLGGKLSNKDSLGGKLTTTFDNNKSINQNISLNQVGNVYSQSATVDPFLSVSYFYDEEAVHKFEAEFKRWLNYILTPPADLDSNVEQKIDVGKAWIENRNKEVPAAPTREQVCSNYHNSHRLDSLRRSARALLMNPEIATVFQKLNLQIEKKLIAIRTDRNLHLDVGLQKAIMELLLSYNPLWLRIGLEAIYGLVLPLKSNSDIEGLTVFIIQRMFKNPHLKNKHSKSTAPNMLLPAYMEAIKKFTLKKFFMLVFFLDQAKQKKLISHDPCLFCRNAVCKESREIIIRFTRELIAGIGDITKHLRPLGYVVSHKQSYLDEYKYAVHNIALDIRDGVRLTKVMEIILMKNGLLNQLRTPPISRLQKIHNVQVALTALKEANFVIVGDISAQDIADGHREKTLSLLWQLIHVLRAPLFEKAANVIQIWWRKKYEVIVEKRKEEEKNRMRLNNAASIIQYWWRRIQYNRLVEWQMQQVTTATVVFQKYTRKWIYRNRFIKMKRSVLKIEEWYISVKKIKEAKMTLEVLKAQREELRQKSATILQSHVRRWLCMKQYQTKVKKIVLIQSIIRCFILRKYYMQLNKSVTFIQKLYRGKLMMKQAMQEFNKKRHAAVVIQSYYRMIQERRMFRQLKKSVRNVEERYIALLSMRTQVTKYEQIQRSVVLIQSYYRGVRSRKEYIRRRNLILMLQRRIRAHVLMIKQKEYYIQIRNAAITLQKHVRSYLAMKKAKQSYVALRKSTISIQRRYRAQQLMKAQRNDYNKLRNAAITIQTYYRGLIATRRERHYFLRVKNAAVIIQRRYKAQTLMKLNKETYNRLRTAVIAIQQRYRAQLLMKEERSRYLKLKSSCTTIQNAYRAYVLGRQQRQRFVTQKQAAITIQRWIRSCKKGKEVKREYEQTKQACVTIQRIYRAYIISRKQRQEFLKIKTATVRIQNYYRSYIEMKMVRNQFIQLKTSTVAIQRYYKSYLEMRNQRTQYLQMKSAAQLIQKYFRRYRESKRIRKEYCIFRKTTILIQRRYRSICTMRTERKWFLTLKRSVVTIQERYRALLTMRTQRQSYLKTRSAAITIQTRFRAQRLMKEERSKYMTTLNSCILIQRIYRAYLAGKRQREEYYALKKSAVILQQKYRALLAMRKERKVYLTTHIAIVNIQRRFRARALMIKEKTKFQKILSATVTIQSAYRAYVNGKRQRQEYLRTKVAIVTIQTWFRCVLECRKTRYEYSRLRNSVLYVQRQFRANKLARDIRRYEAAKKIQTWFRSLQKRNECRNQFLKLRASAIIVQTVFRRYIQQKRYIATKNAILTIQRFYRSYKVSVEERQKYIRVRTSVIKLQSHVRTFIQRKRYLRICSAVTTIQAAYRLKKQRDLMKIRREAAAICIQKNFRRYLVQTWYQNYRKKILYLQKVWRGKLVTRLLRCEYLQKRRVIVKLQAAIRGYLVRRHVQCKKADIQKTREEQKRHWAASVIQAHYRGHKVRISVTADRRVADLRRRWREGALKSTQESLKERNEEAMEVLRNMSDIETVIRAFRSLELLTEVFPMMYNNNASSIVRRVYIYMSVTNRSISSIEVLKSAASLLVNLTRYRVTGPKIYARERIPPILKFMWRFSNSETLLFCILCTYLWLFSKYDGIREDLTEFLNIPENQKMLATIKSNVERTKRMANNARNKFHTPQTSKVSQTGRLSMNYSICSNKNDSFIMPALEPDYGITRVDKPRYFEDANQAITCLFHTYNL